MMIWGFMAWPGPDSKVQITGRMVTGQCKSLLGHKLIPRMEATCLPSDMPPTSQLIFQQENDPGHTTRATEQFVRHS